MKLWISPEAQAWYESEMGVSKENGVRFKGKVYGSSPIHEGFSLAIEVESARQPIARVDSEKTFYFIEEADEWFFEGYDFEVKYDSDLQEPTYNYIPQAGSGAPEAKVDAVSGASEKG